jgi:hypothetical protein
VPAGIGEHAGAAVLVHEPAGRGDLVLDAGRLPARLAHHLGGGALLAGRVARPRALLPRPARARAGARGVRERLHDRQLVLVHHWNAHAAGFRPQPAGKTRQRRYLRLTK